MLISYNWLQDFLGHDLPQPEELAELLTFHAFEIDGVETVDDDVVLDVDVLPNRSSDCLSHYGMAQELSAILDIPVVFDPLAAQPTLPDNPAIAVDIEDEKDCPRFTAQLLSEVSIKPSPDWLQARLRAMGQRPINTVVDATNYVMYGLGQPMHAYDAKKFAGRDNSWRFGVRRAHAEEVVTLLKEGADGQEREVALSGGELLITQADTDSPVALAGVKGGKYAEVDDSTTDILIEAANFDPTSTRKTARGYNIITDASKRFENELSPVLAAHAQVMIQDLLADIAGAKSEGWVDVYPKPKEQPKVKVRPERVNQLLGLSLSNEAMVQYLKRLNIIVEDKDDVLYCTGPSLRTDLTIEEDLIEEVGRLHGYANVKAILPEPKPLESLNKLHFYSERVRARLLEWGFSEVITSSFRKKDQIKLRNALASDKGCLRSTLAVNIHQSLDRNAPFMDYLGVNDIRLFEIGTVFTKTETGVSEHVALCLGARVRPAGYSGKEDAILEEAVREVDKIIGKGSWQIKKGVAECDLTERIAELPEPESYDPVAQRPLVTYRPFSMYPSVSRDIAMWVDTDTTAEIVQEILGTHAGSECVRIWLFDEFSKDGRTSYAFRLVFQAGDRTLTDEEVNEYMEVVYEKVKEQGWEVR